MLKLDEFRNIYKEYDDLTDYELTRALHQKKFADMPFEQFARGFGGPLKEDRAEIAARQYNQANPDNPITADDIRNKDRSGLLGGAKLLFEGIGDSITDTLPDSIARIWRAGDIGPEKRGWADDVIERQRKDQAARIPSLQEVEGSSLAQSLYEGPQSVATSVATGLMGAYLGGAAGSVVPGVGTVAGAMVGAGAMTLPAFYRMAKDQFVEEVQGEYEKKNGKKLTQAEADELNQAIDEDARKFGIYEAAPEALGQMFTAGLIGGAGGRVLRKLGMDKLAETLGKRAFVRIPAKLGLDIAEEEITEASTFMGQEGIRKEYGLRDTEPTIGEFIETQAGPVAVGSLLQMGLMGGAKYMGDRLKNRYGESQSGEEQDDANQAAPTEEPANAPSGPASMDGDWWWKGTLDEEWNAEMARREKERRERARANSEDINNPQQGATRQASTIDPIDTGNAIDLLDPQHQQSSGLMGINTQAEQPADTAQTQERAEPLPATGQTSGLMQPPLQDAGTTIAQENVNAPVNEPAQQAPIASIPSQSQINNTQEEPRADTRQPAQDLGMPAPDPVPQEAQPQGGLMPPGVAEPMPATREQINDIPQTPAQGGQQSEPLTQPAQGKPESPAANASQPVAREQIQSEEQKPETVSVNDEDPVSKSDDLDRMREEAVIQEVESSGQKITSEARNLLRESHGKIRAGNGSEIEVYTDNGLVHIGDYEAQTPEDALQNANEFVEEHKTPQKDGMNEAEAQRFVEPVIRAAEHLLNTGNKKTAAQKEQDKKAKNKKDEIGGSLDEKIDDYGQAQEQISSNPDNGKTDQENWKDERQADALPLVATVGSGVIHKTDTMSAIQAAQEWIQQHITEPVKTKIGNVIVDAKGVKDSLQHLMHQNKLDAVQSIDAVLKNGAYIGNLPDKEGKPIVNHYFAGRVRIGEEEKVVFVRTREAQGTPNRFYVHEVFTEDEIKKRVDSIDGSDHTTGSRYNGPLDFYKNLIANYLKVKSGEASQNAVELSQLDKPLERFTREELIQKLKQEDRPAARRLNKQKLREFVREHLVQYEESQPGNDDTGNPPAANIAASGPAGENNDKKTSNAPGNAIESTEKQEDEDGNAEQKAAGRRDSKGNGLQGSVNVSGTEAGWEAGGSDQDAGGSRERDLSDGVEQNLRGNRSKTGGREVRGGNENRDGHIGDAERSGLAGSVRSGDGVRAGGSDGRNVRQDNEDTQRGRNYLAKPGHLARVGSWLETARRNLEIIELVKRLESENRSATREEQALLAQYVGWGPAEIRNNIFPTPYGSREVVPDYAKEEWKPLAERAVDLLTEEELDTALQSTQYAHYTSEKMIRAIWQGLQKLGFQKGKILEPGMGTGLFAMAAPEDVISRSSYTGVEMDKLTARIARFLLPESNILNNDFVKQKFPDNFFDLAIGNPPFANITVLDDPAYKKYRFNLHDYFFAKSLDKVRPGGLLVFVTSKGTMDKASDKARSFMAERADLVGAVRLPQTAFKQNAGTDVVTDVIFLRKRLPGEKAAGQAWQELAEVDTPEGKTLVNEYFAAHPEMVLGKHSLTGKMYHSGGYTVLPIDGDIEQHFTAAVQNLPENIYSEKAEPQATTSAKVQEPDYDPKSKKEGGLYIDDNGVLRQLEDGVGIDIAAIKKLKPNDVIWLKDYVELRDALKQAQYDQLGDGDWEASLKKLNELYDAFVKKHGNILTFTESERTMKDKDGNNNVSVIRKFKNKNLFELDVESQLTQQLEKITKDGKIEKGSFLKGRTIGKRTKPEIRNAKDALMVSLDEKGVLDLDDIAEKAAISREKVIQELGDFIFEAPGTGWQMADEYLSGDVVTKLEEAQTAARTDKRFDRNVQALAKVQPKPLDAGNINIELGANWVPVKYVNQFVSERLGLDLDEPITYNQDSGTYYVSGSNRRTLRNSSSEWGIPQKSPYELLSAILNNQSVKVVVKDGNGSTVTDGEATAQANEKMKAIREEFASWIWQDKDRTGDLLKIYNRKFNNLAPRAFDGSHLTLPGLSLRYNLYPHQKRAIWRIIQTGNTYLAHAVGAGKTLEMIVAGMEQKRLGLINRPMYVVPNHMLAQFSSEFQDAYPLARIMVADEKQFDKAKRGRFVAQVTMNAPDAVIITHSAFGNIAIKPETSAKVINEFIRQLEEALEECTDRISRSKLEKRIEQAKRKMAARFDAKKDNVVFFEDMGVDFLFVDEAHEFRKLDFVTNRANVKGIDPMGSQRALDLFTKLEWLKSNHPGRSHVFASGTPITNTMAELYTLMRYMNPEALDELGLNTFDSWATMFGRIQAGLEQNAAGSYEMVERFSKFVNVPELMSRVRGFMDVLTMQQLGDLVKRPDLKGRTPSNVIAQPSEELMDFLKNVLAERIERSKKWRPSREQPGNPDPIINIITDGKLAAIDMRFVDPDAKNDPNSKLNIMIDNIIKTHREIAGKEYVDSETGKKDPIKGGAQIVFSMDGFGEQVAKNRGFNLRAYMMQRFKEGGIPSSQVAWMSDYKKHEQKEAMFKKVRSGEIRILIGTPKNMGTGVNVQKRLYKLHYLSAPWYPADVEQPHGRILRQGNQNPEVEINWYATKGTYDSTTWNMVSRKAQFIQQAFTGDVNLRTMEDISEASQYEMASALAAGDERAIQLAALNADIERLSRLKRAHASEQMEFLYHKERLETEILREAEARKGYNKALELAGKEKITADNFRAQIGRTTYEKQKEAGEAIFAKIDSLLNEWDPKKQGSTHKVLVGSIGNENCILSATFRNISAEKGATGKSLKNISLRIGDLNFEIFDATKESNSSPSGIVTRMVNKINGLQPSIDDSLALEKRYKAEKAKIEKRIGEPFPQEAELNEKIADAAILKDALGGKESIPEDVASEDFETWANGHPEEFKEWAKNNPDKFQSYIDNGGVVDFDLKPVDASGSLTGNSDPHPSISPGEFLPSRNGNRKGVKSDSIRKSVNILNKGAKNAAVAEVVQSFRDLPQDLQRRYAGNSTSLEAVYDPRTKKVWFVADNISDARRAVEVWAHEQIVHNGLRGMLSEGERTRLLNQLWLSLGGLGNSLVKKIAKTYGLDPRASMTDRQTLMEEVVARLAERKQAEILSPGEQSMWRKIVRAIARAWNNLVDKITGRNASMGYEQIDKLLEALGGYVMNGIPTTGERSQNTDYRASVNKGQTNSYGVPMERVTVIGKVFTRKEAEAALEILAGQDLPNLMEGISAQINNRQRGKLVSDTAKGKSLGNGFTAIQHYEVAGRIANAWKWSVETNISGRKEDAPNVEFRRFVSSVKVNGVDGFAIISVKDTAGNLKIYSVELANENQIKEKLLRVEGHREEKNLHPYSARSVEEILDRLKGPVNEEKPLASLNLRDILHMGARQAAHSANDPLIRRAMPRDDLTLLQRFTQLPHWIAKQFGQFKAIYERQMRRQDERASALRKSLEQVPSLFGKKRISGADRASLASMLWEMEGQQTGLEKMRGVKKFVSAGVLDNGREILAVNPQFYDVYQEVLDGMSGTAKAKAALMEIRKSLDNDFILAHNRMAEMSEVGEDAITAFRDNIGAIPNYFPHHRYGKYYIQGKLNGEVVYRRHFDQPGGMKAAETAARKLIRQLRRENPNEDWARQDVEWTWDKNTSLPDAVLGAPIDAPAMEQIIKAATDKITDQDVAGQIRDILHESVADVLKARGWASHAIMRQNIPGYEMEDIERVLYDYKAGLNGWLTKIDASRDFAKMLSGIDGKKQPQLWLYASQYVKDMLRNADNLDRIVGQVKSLAFVWYLGANLKSAAVNATQNIVVGVPRLQMDVTAGASFWLKSAGASLMNQITGGSGRGLNPMEARLIQELDGEKVLNADFMDEVRGQLDGYSGARIWKKITEILGMPMSQVETFNRTSLALAAFRAAMAGKMKKSAMDRYGVQGTPTYEQAKKFAIDVVRDAHFVYGKTNQPEFLRSNVAGRAASSMYTFRFFSHSMLNMWLWALKTQGKEGAMFTAKSLGMTMALGGLTAFPFYATLMALFQAVTGDDDDWTEEIRKKLPESNLLRDMVCYGVPAMAGVNIGGSLKMETPVTQGLRKGSNPSEVWTHSLGDIIGIPYDLAIVKPTRIMEALDHDNYWRAIEESVPTFIKNGMEAFRLHEEGQTTMSGRPINSPGQKGARKLSDYGAVGKFFGFQPVDSTKSYESYLAQKRREEVRDAAINKIVTMVIQAKKGNGTQAQAVREMQKWNERMKEEGKSKDMFFNWKDVARRVRSRMRENTRKPAQIEKGKRQMEVWGV